MAVTMIICIYHKQPTITMVRPWQLQKWQLLFQPKALSVPFDLSPMEIILLLTPMGLNCAYNFVLWKVYVTE